MLLAAKGRHLFRARSNNRGIVLDPLYSFFFFFFFFFFLEGTGVIIRIFIFLLANQGCKN